MPGLVQFPSRTQVPSNTVYSDRAFAWLGSSSKIRCLLAQLGQTNLEQTPNQGGSRPVGTLSLAGIKQPAFFEKDSTSDTYPIVTLKQ